MKPFNCTITAAAYSLGVSPEELALWVEQKNPTIKAKPQTVNDVGEEMAKVLESTNPLLAHRWRLVSVSGLPRPQAS